MKLVARNSDSAKQTLARNAVMLALPTIAAEAVADLFARTNSDPYGEQGEQAVTQWARDNRMYAPWLVDRLCSVVNQVHVIGSPADDPTLWVQTAWMDKEPSEAESRWQALRSAWTVATETQEWKLRIRLIDERKGTRERQAAFGRARREHAEQWRALRLRRPIEADPRRMTEKEFLVWAKQHYKAVAAAARAAGFTLARKERSTTMHAEWLVMRRVHRAPISELAKHARKCGANVDDDSIKNELARFARLVGLSAKVK